MLTYTPDGGGVMFSIDFDRFDCHDLRTGTGRWSYKCTIIVDDQTIDAGTIGSGADCTQDNPTRLGEMLSTFLNFFSAYVEAVYRQSMGHHVEDADLFPPSCKGLAEQLDHEKVFAWADEVHPKL